MSIGGSVFLIAVGAILRYAVTATVSGISIQTVGLILMLAGIFGLVLSLLYLFAWRPRRAGERIVDEGGACGLTLTAICTARFPSGILVRSHVGVQRTSPGNSNWLLASRRMPTW